MKHACLLHTPHAKPARAPSHPRAYTITPPPGDWRVVWPDCAGVFCSPSRNAAPPLPSHMDMLPYDSGGTLWIDSFLFSAAVPRAVYHHLFM